MWVFMVWLPKSSGFLRLLLQTDAKSWKSIDFLDFSSIRTGQPAGLWPLACVWPHALGGGCWSRSTQNDHSDEIN